VSTDDRLTLASISNCESADVIVGHDRWSSKAIARASDLNVGTCRIAGAPGAFVRRGARHPSGYWPARRLRRWVCRSQSSSPSRRGSLSSPGTSGGRVAPGTCPRISVLASARTAWRRSSARSLPGRRYLLGRHRRAELNRHHPEVVATLILVDAYVGWKRSLPEEEVRAGVEGVRHLSCCLDWHKGPAGRAR
jgi:hypothetical protein